MVKEVVIAKMNNLCYTVIQYDDQFGGDFHEGNYFGRRKRNETISVDESDVEAVIADL